MISIVMNGDGHGGFIAKLATLKPRLKVIDTHRIKPVYGGHRRINGGARVSPKRHIWVRDSGQCYICSRITDLHESELDHRITLQFGGGGSKQSLWTFCTRCHAGKSAREAAGGRSDEEALKYSIPDEGKAASAQVYWASRNQYQYRFKMISCETILLLMIGIFICRRGGEGSE